jgi:hypothetical protein
MKIYGVYFYETGYRTYPICYKNIYLKNLDSVVITRCDNDKNFTIKHYNPNNNYLGYDYNKSNDNIIPIAPMTYNNFHFLMGLSGLMFGFFIFFFLAKIFTSFRK